MNNLTKNIFILLLTISALSNACVEPIEYPVEPSIEFRRVYAVDSVDNEFLGNIVKHDVIYFYLIDGDGDIGLRTEDTIEPYEPGSRYYYNLYVRMYAKNKGKYEYIKMTDSLFYRIPFIDHIGQNKYLKAEISVDIQINYKYDTINQEYYIYNGDFNKIIVDTVKYDIYMIDRAFNESNIISTPDIPWNFQGTITDTTMVPLK